MTYAPIALFVYNRPEHTRKTVEALVKNTLAIESELSIFSDAPRRSLDEDGQAKDEESKNKILEVREYLKTISGFKKVEIVERDENMGLAKSIISGVTEIINKYGKIIVLEDDLVTSPYFLEYMNGALDLYENNEKVISIHGYIYPIKKKLPETFFLKNPSCWGWATWKRGWDLFEPDGEKLMKKMEEKSLIKKFNFENTFHYFDMLKRQTEGKNNSWAVRWYASAFLKDKLTLYPGKSLINNIGFDGSGIHSNKTEVYKSNMADDPIAVRKIEIKEDLAARQKIIKYFKSMRPKIIKRIYWKIKNFLPVKTKVLILNFIPNIKKELRIMTGKIKGISIIVPNPKTPNYYLSKNKFNSDSVIIDVGCGFDADFSVYMIKKYGLKAIGIDPTLKHKESLEKLVKESAGKFTHKTIAISRENGKIIFNESEENVSGSILRDHKNIKNNKIKTYEVESISLGKLPDYLHLHKIQYIKLDIEGAEYDLIEKLKREDLAKYDQIFVEFHHHATDYSLKDTSEAVRKISGFGFKNFSINNHDFLFYRQ